MPMPTLATGIRRNKGKPAAGFTFVELLIVISIAVLLAFMAAPAWRNYTGVAALRSGAYEVASLLRYAHLTAVEEGYVRRVQIDLQEGTYWLEPLPAGLTAHWEKRRTFGDGVAVAVEIAGTSASASAVQEIVFQPDGTATPAVIVLRAPAGSFKVTVYEATGLVRVEKSTGAAGAGE